MALASPFLRGLDAQRYGLRWRWADIECAHPLDDGSAAVVTRSVTETAKNLGTDEKRWRALFHANANRFDRLAEDLLAPVIQLPRHPLLFARFGAPTLLPATTLSRAFSTEHARALFGGVALHGMTPLHHLMSSAIGLGLLTAAQSDGWPVAQGGSQAITNALAAALTDLGAKIETGVHIRSASQLPPADVTMFDLGPAAVADILGNRLPGRVARAYRRFRHGPAAFKVDFAVEDGVPWTSPQTRRAGTVHLGGTLSEMAATARAIHAGRMPERPFVLVGQQYLADPQRSNRNVHPVYSYAHVPHGYTGGATQAIISQIERFAPGFRDRIVATAVQTPADFAADNPNFTGGDIITGAKNPMQLIFGPRPSANPYSVGIPGMYLCSAATPPAPGAHGMCGAHAAARAIDQLSRTRAPSSKRRGCG
jgi:phytoene dehydrogenase-like protein